jgi:putative ABC transport system permease protein
VFEYQLLDDQLDLIYEDEKRLGTLVSIFSVFSFFISGIGLFGIASFMHLRRKKEIGIRKVLGAGFAQLFGTLSKEFVYITLVAVILLLPVSYLVMEEWLNGFAYRTSLSALPFLLAAITCGLFVLLTIAFQTLRSAAVDPVEALKHE